MPTYEYECRKCGHQFERFQSITAAPVRTCPKCKGRVARMLTTGSGIIFKGHGFYETDYKSKSSVAGSPATSTPAPAPSTPSGKKEAKAG